MIGVSCLGMTAAQLMTSLLYTVTPATTVPEAMALMTSSRVCHLPVLDGETLVGLISICNVVTILLGQQAEEVDSLRAYAAYSV